MEDFPHSVPKSGVIDHHVGFVKRAVSAYLADKRKHIKTS